MVLGTLILFLRTVCIPPYKWNRTEQSISMMQDFWQCSEAVGLSQVSKMIRQLSGQISAHCSSSKIRNTHLSLFHPDQGPHTVQCSSRLDYNRSLRSGILYLLEFKPLDLLIETLDCVPSNSWKIANNITLGARWFFWYLWFLKKDLWSQSRKMKLSVNICDLKAFLVFSRHPAWVITPANP